MIDASFLSWPFFEDRHRQFARDLTAWAAKEIPGLADHHDVDGSCRRLVRRLGEGGWLRVAVPQAYGGLYPAFDVRTLCLARETLAYRDGLADFAFAMQGLGAGPISLFGAPALRDRYLPRVAAGEAIAAFAISEADAGSDVAAMRTRAVRDGDDYVLTGTKYWITNAGISNTYTVFAKTSPDAGHRGMSCFLVEKDWGVKIGKLEKKLGVRGSPTGEVIFEDVRVPATHLIGEEGQGFYIAMGTLDRSRPTIGAQAVGIAQGAIDQSTAYVKERRQFGKPIAEFQGVQFMLADMEMKIEAARHLVYVAAAAGEQGRPDVTRVSASAKAFASDVAMQVTTDAVQLFGGAGYTQDFPVERMMRDAKITQIYEGTNQVQRMVIARSLLR